jgi:hypothetical protein
MIRRFRMRRLGRDEGSVLVMALVFLSLFGLLVAAVLSFADASLRSTLSTRDQRGKVYNSDGAADGAINYVRSNRSLGLDPAQYPGSSCSFVLPPVNPVTNTIGGAVTGTLVTCQGLSGSGVTQTSGGGASTVPQKALLALASDPGEGIVQSSNTTLKISGSIFSDQQISNSAASAVLNVQGDVSALGNCTTGGHVVSSSPPLHCANTGGGAVASQGTDPGYAPAVASVNNLVTPPACGVSWIVTFSPGQYNDATLLNPLFGGACSKVMRFVPGNYYFNFTNGGTHLWTINDANLNLIGGTPKGWDPTAVTKPAIPFPGGCKTDQDAAPNDGVQFIFGGDSRVTAGAGTVELCAQPSTAKQEIAIYGVPAGGGASQVTPPALTSSASSTPGVDTGFSPASKILAVDGSGGAATVSNGAVAGATLTGYGLAIPAGSTINAATLVATHQESPPGNASSVQAVVTPAVGSAVTASLTKQGSLSADPVDLVALGLTNPAAFASLSVKYEATAKSGKTITDTLDGVVINVTYTPPGFTAESGCILSHPYAGTCALLTTSGAQTGLALQGTLYAPAAAVDLAQTNRSNQVAARGIIARHIALSVTPSTSCLPSCPAMVSLPSSGPATYADRTVLLTVYPNGSSNPSLRVTVTIQDGGGATPGSAVTITSWSVLH